MAEIDEKRIPIVGDETEDQAEEDTKKDSKGPPPKDSYLLIRMMVLFLGLSAFLVQSFVVTANDYWMYKFRDPAFPTYDANNRTSLQKSFTSTLGVAMAVPTGVGLVVVVTIGQKIKARTRINSAYAVILSMFGLLTLFVKVNTDTWQTGFFVLVMIIMGMMMCSFVFLTASLIVSIPKLPMMYMKLFMYGQSLAAIFSAIVQIICLAIAESSTTVALIYFSVGMAVYGIALALWIASQYSPFFLYYVDENEVTRKSLVPKLADVKRALANMWPVLGIMGLSVLTQTTTHPNVTNLIVSENYGDGTPWTAKYFVPVITFFLADVAGLIGRALSSNFMTRKNKYWFFLVMIACLVVYPPLFVFCNVKAGGKIREAIFKHDWQYIIILITFVPITTFCSNTSVLSLPHFKHPSDKSLDLYYLLMQVILMVFGIALSPLGVVITNFL